MINAQPVDDGYTKESFLHWDRFALRYCSIGCIPYENSMYKTKNYAHLNTERDEIMSYFLQWYISMHLFLLIELYKKLYVLYPAMHPEMAISTSSIHQF